jgi:hypothetical protein
VIILLLSTAAEAARTLRRLHYVRHSEDSAADFRESMRAVSDMVEQSADDYEDIIDIFFPKYSRHPRQFISDSHIRESVCQELGISGLVWDEVLTGQPIVLTLASESNDEPSNLTVKQALMLMHRLNETTVLDVAKQLSSLEAEIFWSRALGEDPAYPIDRFIQRCSHLNGSTPLSLKAVRRILDTMSPAEYLVKTLKDDSELVKPLDHMQPGQPFRGPVFKSWTQTTAPGNSYLEVIKAQRRYLHVAEFPAGTLRGTLYNQDKQPVGKIDTMFLPVQTAGIYEVEVGGNTIISVNDVLSMGQDWEIYKQTYRERIELLKATKFKVPIKVGRLLEEGENLTNALIAINDNERLRLKDGGRFDIGGHGGFVVMDGAYQIHLLATSVKKDAEYETHLRLGVLDGFDPYQVMEAKLNASVANHLRTRLAKHGVLVGNHWLPIEEQAIVLVAQVKDMNLSTMAMVGEIMYVDDNLGYSDTSQLTDLIEMI